MFKHHDRIQLVNSGALGEIELVGNYGYWILLDGDNEPLYVNPGQIQAVQD